MLPDLQNMFCLTATDNWMSLVILLLTDQVDSVAGEDFGQLLLYRWIQNFVVTSLTYVIDLSKATAGRGIGSVIIREMTIMHRINVLYPAWEIPSG